MKLKANFCTLIFSCLTVFFLVPGLHAILLASSDETASGTAQTPTLFPWHEERAEVRQLFRFESGGVRDGFTVEIPLEPESVLADESAGELKLIDPENPAEPVAFQWLSSAKEVEAAEKDAEPVVPATSVKGSEADSEKSAARVCRITVSGTISPEKPRWLFAYRGKGLTSQKPESSTENASPKGLPAKADDFAVQELGRPWSFEDGRFDQIAYWGDRPWMFGKVTVEDGWLTIPILGKDAYFVLGEMWGRADSPKYLKINSSVYRYLEMEVQQSVPVATWSIFVTDADGRWQSAAFVLKGTGAQRVRLDLAQYFSGFWGKRTFRAIRIDPIELQPNTVAKVHWVRLLPDPIRVTAGAVWNRTEWEFRNQIQKVAADAEVSLAAGEAKSLSCQFRVADSPLPTKSGTATPRLRVRFALNLTEDSEWRSRSASAHHEEKSQEVVLSPDGNADVNLPILTRAGIWRGTVGICDDLGGSCCETPLTVTVVPGKLCRYELVPENVWWDVSQPIMKVKVAGVDPSGNLLPISGVRMKLEADPGMELIPPEGETAAETATPASRELSGRPAEISLRLRTSQPQQKLRLKVTDEEGRSGETELRTIRYRSERVALAANGLTVREDGTPYLVVGGLYGNWPHQPVEDGKLRRSLDLFPCGPLPYLCGNPWSEEVEALVRTYFEHCRKHEIRTIRLMLRNLDLVGKVDQTQFDAVVHYLKLGHEYGMKFNVVLMEDYSKPPYVNEEMREKIVLPHYSEAELAALPPYRARFLVQKDLIKSRPLQFLDPDVRLCQKDYLREVISVLAGIESVFCYEFENEMHDYPSDAWCREMTDFIHSIDPHTLILGNPHDMTRFRALQWRNSGCDLIAYHTYSTGFEGVDQGTCYLMKAKWAALANRPFLTGEGGVYDFQAETDEIRTQKEVQGIRDHIWCNFCAGGIGFEYWTLLNESIANEIDKISETFRALELDPTSLQRHRPRTAIVVPAGLEQDGSEGVMERFCQQLVLKLLERGVDFDCVPKGEEGTYATRLDLTSGGQAVLPTEDFEQLAKLAETLPADVAQPSRGWDAVTLVSEDETRAMLYLRNRLGGVRDFSADPEHHFFFRDAQIGSAELKLTQPKRWRRILAHDLQTGETQAVTPNAEGIVTLKASDGDFVLGFHAN